MKYAITLSLFALFFWSRIYSQNVGINTTDPDPSSELDVYSTSKGFLAPRMTRAQKDVIANPAKGLLIYQTDEAEGFYVFGGAVWVRLGESFFKTNADTIVYSRSENYEKDLVFNAGSVSYLPEEYTKMMFLPSKGGAFRAGRLLASGNSPIYWNPIYIGESSFAAGTGTAATAPSSFAMGNGSIASREAAVAMGYSSEASGTTSVAIGHANRASGYYSIAMGRNSNAKKDSSVAVGYKAVADGAGAFAIGTGVEAFANSLAMGKGAQAKKSGIAIGNDVITEGDYAAVIGSRLSSSLGNGSVVVGGYMNSAKANMSSVLGGTNNEAIGMFSAAVGGSSNAAVGNNSLVSGAGNQAAGSFSTILNGLSNKVSGAYSAILGGEDNDVSGDYSVVTGTANISKASQSLVFGNGNDVDGKGSFIMGDNIKVQKWGTGPVRGRYDSSFIFGYNIPVPPLPNPSFVQDFGVTNSFFAVGGRHSDGTMYPTSHSFKALYDVFALYVSYDGAANKKESVVFSSTTHGWQYTSDSSQKENYQPAGSVLDKIASMKLDSWNFKGSDKATARHYGPFAQEFFRNFGNDGVGTVGVDTGISEGDIAGINMIAIQQLIQENEKLKATQKSLEERMSRLEALVNQKP